MLETRKFGLLRNVTALTITIIFLHGCFLDEEQTDEAENSAALAVEEDFEISGSVGDGPVVGANMRAMRNDGVELKSFKSDSSAGYNIVIRTKGRYYPLTIDAVGGTDLVTNAPPDFTLIGAALEPSKKYVVNLNPFSTVIMEMARDLTGGPTKSNIYAAQDILAGAMDFGLVSMPASGPMNGKIDSGNVAEIVRGSEGVGEVVRRTRDWLLFAGYVWDGDDVIGALGSDLIDGVIDGRGGPRVNARLAAIANLVITQVLLELTANELHVNGADATALLESAIETMKLGTASPSISELTATSGMLFHVDVGMDAADTISDDSRVSSLKTSAAGLQPGLQPMLARSLLPADYRQTMDDVILMMLTSGAQSSTMIDEVNDTVRIASGVVNDPQDGNSPPSISGTPPASVTKDTLYSFTPVASDADGDTLTFSFSGLPAWITTRNTSTGRISGTPGDAQVGTYTGIVISVSDGQSSASLGPFSITVNATSLGSATLSWQPPTQYEDGTPLGNNLAGFKIYWGTTPGSYSNSVTLNNPGLTTYVVENLAPGTYEFVATAYDVSGVESRFSNAATKTVQ
ncbi:MAG: putative Ig domain-containing protein [Woeseiaceae bacterium]|nr:putative Ig domain-containing protein [Woeseiaceae bacterium]